MTSKKSPWALHSPTNERAGTLHMSMPVVLGLATLLVCTGFCPTTPLGSIVQAADAQLISEVSGERMMNTIEDLQGFGSRAFYLDSSRDVAQYLHDRFTELGLEVEYDEFSAGVHEVVNVIATKTGEAGSEARLLLGAHYDSENMEAESYELGAGLPAPGADDDASGIAAVLELARVLSDYQTSRTIQFAAFTAEENGYDGSGGLAGSEHFAFAEKSRGTQYEASVILDMIGHRGSTENHVAAIVSKEDPPIVRSIRSGISKNGINLSFSVVEDEFASYSDQYSFWSAGYPAILLIEADPHSTSYSLSPHYHTANDTIDKLSQEQIAETTKGLLSGILGLLNPREKTDTLLIVIALSGAIIAVSAMSYFYLRSRKVGRT